MCHPLSRPLGLIAAIPLYCLAPLPELTAQNVTVALTALTPLEARVQSFAQVDVDSLPAGPLPAHGHLEATGVQQSGTAIINWFQASAPDRHDIQITSHIIAPNGSIATPSTGPFEMLIELSTASPTPVEITLEGSLFLSTGTPAPMIAIDVDNDGLINYPDLTLYGSTTLQPTTLGAQPRQLRILMASETAQLINTEQSVAQLRVLVRPQNLLQITRTATSCTPPFDLEIHEVFADRGIDFWQSNALYVLGAGRLPTLWTPQSVVPFFTTCLLMPSPDVLVWQPFGPLHIPLPDALRPFDFHVQAVVPTIPGWTTTDAYHVQAF